MNNQYYNPQPRRGNVEAGDTETLKRNGNNDNMFDEDDNVVGTQAMNIVPDGV